MEGREIACFPFVLVSQEELLQAVSITDLCINAEDKIGRIIKKPVTISLSEHRAIAPTLEVRIGILAPNVLFAFSVELMEEERILMRAEFELHLDEPIKRVKCRRIQLDALDGGVQRPERRFIMVALVADEKKAPTIHLDSCPDDCEFRRPAHSGP